MPVPPFVDIAVQIEYGIAVVVHIAEDIEDILVYIAEPVRIVVHIQLGCSR